MSEADDWQSRWRKMMPFGPWSFPDIDEMMKEMEKDFMQFKDMEKQVPKDLIRERKSPDGSVRKEIGPIVYGYSMTIGPDGKPVIREFGNVKRSEDPLRGITDQREPLTDVVESDKQVRIIAEIPGAKKEDIEMQVNDRTLTITVDTAERKYRKELQLPQSVMVEGAKSNFNNGILEVTFPKKQGKSAGVRLKVE
ncbi:MAG: Hsp20/alpha crystallin family protein [Thaumarchaeota archaeon]|nr:Hsp20/alpha crystallin family protein [Nitrososphaerota archaeon]